jgi:hypothetical protein
LGASCRRLDWQLSFAAQILSQLSPLLSGVHSLSIESVDHQLPAWEEEVDPSQWLELFRPFSHVGWVHVTHEELVPGIARALNAEGMTTDVLPELTELLLIGYRRSPSVAKAAKQFVARRNLAGRAVRLDG